jgi:hypothetical protein
VTATTGVILGSQVFSVSNLYDPGGMIACSTFSAG